MIPPPAMQIAGCEVSRRGDLRHRGATPVEASTVQRGETASTQQVVG